MKRIAIVLPGTTVAAALVGCSFFFDTSTLGPDTPSSTVDGSMTADSAADALPMHFCATAPGDALFCSDFDGDGDLTAGWDNAHFNPDTIFTGGGALDTESNGIDGTRAVAMVLPATPSGAVGPTAFLLKVFGTVPDEIQIGARLRLDDTPTAKAIVLVDLAFGAGSDPAASDGEIAIKRSSGGNMLTWSSDTQQGASVDLGDLPRGRWVDLHITFQRVTSADGGTGAIISVDRDGTKAGDLEGPSFAGARAFELAIGASALEGSPISATRVSFDNVLVTSSRP